MKISFLLIIVSLFFTGCAHVTPYGQGCRDGVRGLEPQLGAVGAALQAGDAVDRYCDQIENQHNSKSQKSNK